MDLASPINSVIPGVAGVVLQILARTDQSLTGHGIADLAHGRSSRAGVTRVLTHLVASGLVDCRPAGRANLYSLNRDHVAARAIEQLAELRTLALERITTHVASWEIPPTAVWMFGSAARGDGTVESDIDLLVLRPESTEEEHWTRQTMDLSKMVRAWTGNRCEILEYTERELDTLVSQKDSLVNSLRKDSIVLFGAHVEQILGKVS